MTVTSLLLLSSLLAAPLAATQAADALASQAAGAQQLPTPEQREDFSGEPDGICYKIRAYIFKRDDDRAPELAGSTTCGPRQPHAKNAVWPKGRLVPAD
ncbi:MAG TPA: hypothetical protein VKG65_03630 [Terriglobales bacterium]|nr:hypothetical protein [Terriglobales bacterium]